MDQKSDDKMQEKETEKGMGEKWQRDPLSTMVWALILIWAGTAFLLWNTGILQGFRLPSEFGPWTLVFTGAGLILLGLVVVRKTVPSYSGPTRGALILGLIFLAIGLGDILPDDLFFPLAMIGIGMIIIVRYALRRR